jgi:hypothetical protein
MTAVRPLRLADTVSKAGFDELDPISQWFLGGSTAPGADATGISDDDRYGLDLLNVGSGGKSWRATSGNGLFQGKIDNSGTSFSGGLSITGPASFSSHVAIAGSLSVTGAANFQSSIDVTGVAFFRTDVTMFQGLSVSQSMTVSGNLNISGSLTVTQTATFVTNVTMNQGLTVSQSASVGGNLTVTGTATLKSTVVVNDWSLTVSGDDLVFQDDGGQEIFRLGDTSSSEHAKVTGPMKVTGNITLEGTLDHDGNQIGFFGSSPNSKPTVSGSRGGNAALQDLCSELANLGLITDNTS